MSDSEKMILGQDGKPLKLEEKKNWKQLLIDTIYSAKEKPNFILSVLAFMISLVSLGFSIRNTVIFAHQVNIEKAEYLSSVNAIWKAEIHSDEEEMRIVANKSNIILQKGVIHFPSEFELVREVYPPNNSFPLSLISYELESYARASIKDNLQEDHALILEGSIPILIDSYYTVDGDLFHNKGIYAIRFLFFAYSNNLYDSSIEIEGVSYVGRLEQLEYQQDSQTTIDMIWQTWEDQ